MSHHFFEGKVYHKRFMPTVHEFTYPFYLLDIDLEALSSLKNRLFALEGFNLFSFKSKDHFGKHQDFRQNVDALLQTFGMTATQTMHFMTLPRVFNFVFNPISMLILFENEHPTHLFAEVHNYNGGRVVYPVKLIPTAEKKYRGEVLKTMYVSPFFQNKGNYRFDLYYETHKISLRIDLYEEGQKKLTASFIGTAKPFQNSTVVTLFARHSFLTLWVVTRTLWQTLKLWHKGLTFHSPTPEDQIRRY